jgi:GntR family transcriptional repressor for pyruvate dehydrogenase complex
MNPLQPVERSRVYELIVEKIKELIDNGTWKPGDRLPSERKLTKMLGVGRTSVREATRMLEAMGYIEIRPGDGVYITENAQNLNGFQTLVNVFQDDDYIVDVMETRELVESQIAFLAAESATEEDVIELETLIDRHEKIIEKGEDGVEENIAFHLFLAKITGNRALMELQQLLFNFTRQTITGLYHVPGRPEESILQHKNILQSIKEHQPKIAHSLMLEHLRSRYKIPKRAGKSDY